MAEYDLAVAYRVYPKVSKKPAIHADSKPKLAEFCLKSFKHSVKGLKVKMFAILDGCPPSYERMFKKYFKGPDLEIIHTEAIGNYATFGLQIETLLKQNDAELVYFAEDDYFYLPDTFKQLTDFFEENVDCDFISPYDHLDSYTLPLHRYPSIVRYRGERHFRTIGTTCLTFLTDKNILQKSRKLLYTYSQGNHDASMWLTATKERVFDFGYILKSFLKNNTEFFILKRAWRKKNGWFKILFGPRYRLFNPVPAVATHLEHDLLSPGIDWPAEFKKAQKRK